MPTTKDYHLLSNPVNLSTSGQSTLPPDLHQLVTSELGPYTEVQPCLPHEVRGTCYTYPDGEVEITSIYIHDADMYDNKTRGRVNSFNPMSMTEEQLRQFRYKYPKKYKAAMAEWSARYEKNKKQADKSARTRVRRKCHTAGLDHLLTLTTRDPVTDVSDMNKLVESFMRRVRLSERDYKMVGVHQYHPDRPDSLHTHMGVKGWQKLSMLRSCWHKVLGCPVDGNNHDDCGVLSPGAIHVKSPGKQGGSQWKLSKLSSYLTRYMVEGGVDVGYKQKRYLVSQHIGLVVQKFRYGIFNRGQVPLVVATVLSENYNKPFYHVGLDWFSSAWGEGVYACSWH